MSYPTRSRDRPSRGGSSTPVQMGYGSTSTGMSNYGSTSVNPRQMYIATPTRGPPTAAPGVYPSGAPPPRPAYRHPETYESGPLGYFLPPPGQPTKDSTLSTPPVTQALWSTYPSRMRTGVTNLVQPETITGGVREREYFLAELDREIANSRGGSGTSTPRLESPVPTGILNVRKPTTISGRRGRFVNYAEKESDDESEDDLSDIEEPDSDPDDGTFGERGTRRRTTDRSNHRRDDRANSSHITMIPPTLPSGAPMNPEQAQAAARAAKLRRKYAELEKGWTWLGDRTPGERVRSVPVRSTRHDYRSEETLAREALRPELLVPITVDMDVPSGNPDINGIKIKDRFLWNLNEPFMTPHDFSTILCTDLGISSSHATTIAELIQAQIEEAQAAVEIDIYDREITEEDVEWSDEEVEQAMEVDVEEVVPPRPSTSKVNGHAEVAPKGLQEDQEQDKDDGAADEEDGEEAEDEEVEEDVVEEKVWAEADCRIIINLEVQIYNHILRDRFEWDLSSSLPPSDFARAYARDLGITGEAIPLIACAITDEILKHKRDALDLRLFGHSHPDEQSKWEKVPGGGPRVNRRDGAKGLVGVWRDWWDREEFGPVLVELTMEEMERRELERTREARRIMRTLTGAKRRR